MNDYQVWNGIWNRFRSRAMTKWYYNSMWATRNFAKFCFIFIYLRKYLHLNLSQFSSFCALKKHYVHLLISKLGTFHMLPLSVENILTRANHLLRSIVSRFCTKDSKFHYAIEKNRAPLNKTEQMTKYLCSTLFHFTIILKLCNNIFWKASDLFFRTYCFSGLIFFDRNSINTFFQDFHANSVDFFRTWGCLLTTATIQADFSIKNCGSKIIFSNLKLKPF